VLIDFNHQSGCVYGRDPTRHAEADVTARINAHVDAVLVDRNRRQRPRTILAAAGSASHARAN